MKKFLVITLILLFPITTQAGEQAERLFGNILAGYIDQINVDTCNVRKEKCGLKVSLPKVTGGPKVNISLRGNQKIKIFSSSTELTLPGRTFKY